MLYHQHRNKCDPESEPCPESRQNHRCLTVSVVCVWQDLDPEDSGFVATDKLKDLMEGLDLFAEEEYVDIMRHKIDPDNLGTFKGFAL